MAEIKAAASPGTDTMLLEMEMSQDSSRPLLGLNAENADCQIQICSELFSESVHNFCWKCHQALPPAIAVSCSAPQQHVRCVRQHSQQPTGQGVHR